MNIDTNRKYIILYNSIPYLLPFFNKKNVLTSKVLKNLNLFERILRKLSIKLNIPQYYWFGSWKNNLQSVDTIIIFAALIEPDVLKLIKKFNPKARIIYWYWNPVFRMKKIDKSSLDLMELWSFDPLDCKKLSLRFNTTLYFKEIQLPENTIIYDTMFIGRNKGRESHLKSLFDELIKNGLNIYTEIVSDNHKGIPYSEYLDILSKSKSLIDFVPEGQSGLTVRVMEHLFLKKKLITFDKTIINELFYLKENIFVIGVDDTNEMNFFLDSPYVELPTEIINYYDFEEWLKRFE